MPRVRIAAVLLLALGCARGHKAGPNDLAPPVASAATALSCRTLQSCTDACMDPACAEACVRRLTAAARPAYEALQACVVPACADVDAGAAPCRVPGAFACKLCVLSRCAAQASACMAR
ncbi:MAG: hypothetical protein JWM53_760 [bacterium]|nr:hypothetical protein [bacterium]